MCIKSYVLMYLCISNVMMFIVFLNCIVSSTQSVLLASVFLVYISPCPHLCEIHHVKMYTNSNEQNKIFSSPSSSSSTQKNIPKKLQNHKKYTQTFRAWRHSKQWLFILINKHFQRTRRHTAIRSAQWTLYMF